ncbi:unnamed protein product [Calicophoron daubneyi]|uniref:Transmembrane protein 11 n=1 Tax=Calicophoron daubneyi TaxID=300641 RepID=A0AAV2TID7_CALDB
MTSGKKTYAVIRAVYDNHHAPHDFERQLDFVLTRRVGMVIIEPETLGEITWRWIRTGNWLHKTAVICGFSALATAGIGALWRSNHFPALVEPRWLSGSHAEAIVIGLTPKLIRMSTTLLSAVSASAAGCYALFWQWDPCCKYQVASSLASLPRGVTSVMNCNGGLTTSCHSGRDSPRSVACNGASPNGSSGESHGSRSRPVIVENRFHPHGPPLRPVVLVHRDDNRRKLLHNTLAFTSAFVAGYILFQWSQSSD